VVASILRLRLANLANSFGRPRSGAARGAIAIAALLLVLGIIVMVAVVVVVGPLALDVRRAALVCIGTAVALAFWVLPLVFGSDDGLDPRAFAYFGIPPRPLAGVLALAGIISLPAAALVAFVLLVAGLWADRGVGVVLVAILSGAVAVVMAVLAARIAAAIAAGIANGLTARNVLGLVALAALALAAPLLGVMALLDWPAIGVIELRRWAVVLSWTPFGAPWSAPGDVAAGQGALAVARLAIAVVTIGALWLVWERIVHRAVTSSVTVREARRTDGIGVFAAFPATQTGAVAARSVVYWVRDPRYSVPPLLLPVIPVVLVAAFALAGVPGEITVWLPVPLVCLMIGWLVHNDIATDGTAFWLHVVTGIRGRADRWGRVIVPLVLGVPVAVIGGVVAAVLHGDQSITLPLVSLSLCALLSGLGVASSVSARSPYPSVAPGDGAFAQPQQDGDGHAAHQGWTLLLAALACAPTVALILLGVLDDPEWMLWASVSGVVVGVGVLLIGIESGARVVTRAAPELLLFARSN
jgi:ABC-2 type transport system permease protein